MLPSHGHDPEILSTSKSGPLNASLCLVDGSDCLATARPHAVTNVSKCCGLPRSTHPSSPSHGRGRVTHLSAGLHSRLFHSLYKNIFIISLYNIHVWSSHGEWFKSIPTASAQSIHSNSSTASQSNSIYSTQAQGRSVGLGATVILQENGWCH